MLRDLLFVVTLLDSSFVFFEHLFVRVKLLLLIAILAINQIEYSQELLV